MVHARSARARGENGECTSGFGPAAPATGWRQGSFAAGCARTASGAIATSGNSSSAPQRVHTRVVELDDPAAAGALAAQLLVVAAVEDRGQQPDERDQPRDQEPDEERAALDPADDAAGEAEEEQDHEQSAALPSGWASEQRLERPEDRDHDRDRDDRPRRSRSRTRSTSLSASADRDDQDEPGAIRFRTAACAGGSSTIQYAYAEAYRGRRAGRLRIRRRLSVVDALEMLEARARLGAAATRTEAGRAGSGGRGGAARWSRLRGGRPPAGL